MGTAFFLGGVASLTGSDDILQPSKGSEALRDRPGVRIENMTRLLVCIPDSARSVAVQAYCQYLHSLLGGQISRLSVTAEDHVARVK